MRKIMMATAALATLASGSAGLAQNRPAPYGGGQAGGQYGGQAGAQQPAGQSQAAPRQGASAAQPTGSFTASCRNVQVQGANVTAECHNIHDKYPVSTINFTACRGDLSNQNGVLTCQGATASVPPGQDDGAGGRRNNNGQLAAGVVAGAVLGALGANASNDYPPQQRPQPYAQQPQMGPPPPGGGDWRYGQQGWGYGHRPDEWVSIRERDVWLDRRIDRDLASGDMSRREARDLRRDMQGLEALEYRYHQQGFAPWMRDDLNSRFDGLVQRVRGAAPPAPAYGDRDRTDRDRADQPPPPPPAGGYYGH